ncbi:endonuclease/exonuclease/phosphatase family protein, partial [Salmonella sp. zj-h17]|uniref:endonuclease/exonuclease/phosphatase family protein n=1 Tax=Salmonella sp. zj-h17 TaxID=2582629 RepID=UPI003FA752A6
MDKINIKNDNEVHESTLKILQLNINGTQSKLSQFQQMLNKYNIDLACIQETKLNTNLKLNINGYTTIRKDRQSKNGGGIAFVIKDELKYNM